MVTPLPLPCGSEGIWGRDGTYACRFWWARSEAKGVGFTLWWQQIGHNRLGWLFSCPVRTDFCLDKSGQATAVSNANCTLKYTPVG